MAQNRVKKNKITTTKKKTKINTRKYTKNQKEFIQYQKKINKWQKDLEKRGYEFVEEVIPQHLPKRVTKKQLTRLSQLTKKDLYKSTEYVITEEQQKYTNYGVGEYVRGDEAKKIIRQVATKKSWEKRRAKKVLSHTKNIDITPINTLDSLTGDFAEKEYNNFNDLYETHYAESSKIIVDNYIHYLKSFPINLTSPLTNLVRELVNKSSYEYVAYMLQSLPETFNECLSRYAHDSKGALDDFATQMIEYLPNVSDRMKEDLMDRFTFHEIGYEIEDED